MTRPFLWFRLFAAALLLGALADWPYSYYSLLRVVVTVAAMEVAWVAHRKGQSAWILPFAAAAVLWNPISEVRLPRGTWKILDCVAAVLLAVSVLRVREETLVTRSFDIRTLRYLPLTLATDGALFLVALAPLTLPDGPLPEPWRTGFLILALAALLGILVEKTVYLAHVARNPGVKYKLLWSLAIVIFHFWAELIYYLAYIRHAAPAIGAAPRVSA